MSCYEGEVKMRGLVRGGCVLLVVADASCFASAQMRARRLTTTQLLQMAELRKIFFWVESSLQLKKLRLSIYSIFCLSLYSLRPRNILTWTFYNVTTNFFALTPLPISLTATCKLSNPFPTTFGSGDGTKAPLMSALGRKSR